MSKPYEQLETLNVTFANSVVYVTLNRPEARNAMNFKMVEELTHVFKKLKGNQDYRAIVLSGEGGTFCAGGDIKEMREVYQNQLPSKDSAGNLDVMLRTCNEASQVVIAKVEGAALGGGLGLICVSDIAIATTTAKIGLPEVRLGVAPSFISPFVIERVGFTRARELALTGRRFGGEEAQRYGIVHHVCPTDEIDHCLHDVLDDVLKCSPNALATTKAILFTVKNQPLDDTVDYRAETLDKLRHSDEAQEGLLAFMEKRPAKWVTEGRRD